MKIRTKMVYKQATRNPTHKTSMVQTWEEFIIFLLIICSMIDDKDYIKMTNFLETPNGNLENS
jgi:hypothetical protein